MSIYIYIYIFLPSFFLDVPLLFALRTPSLLSNLEISPTSPTSPLLGGTRKLTYMRNLLGWLRLGWLKIP